MHTKCELRTGKEFCALVRETVIFTACQRCQNEGFASIYKVFSLEILTITGFHFFSSILLYREVMKF